MRHRKSIALQVPGPPPAGALATRPPPALEAPTGARWLVLHLPGFRLERCGYTDQDLAALLEEQHSVPRVAALTPAALARGPEVGMTAAEARALLPALRVELAADPAEEAADLAALARTLERLLPEPIPLGGAALASRIDRVRRPEAGLLRQALALLGQLGHRARGVVADEPQGALALAAFTGEDAVVPPGGLAQALAPLPLRTLGPSPRLGELLELLGVRTISDLVALDPAAVANRLGAEGLHLHTLGRGRCPPQPPPRPPPPARELLRRALLEPVAQREVIEEALRGLCERLGAALAATDRAALRLVVHLELEDHSPHLLSARLGQPRRAPAELLHALRQRLEGVQLPAPVCAVQLELVEACPFTGQQQGLLDRRAGAESLPELLARLADTLGSQALFSPALCPDHRPERRWAARPPSARPLRGATGAPAAARPALLCREPRAIEVRVDARGLPRAVGLDGEPTPVRRAAGPERLQGAWWEPEPMDRDYHRVELADGRVAWIFQDRPSGAWWLHGLWD